MGLLLMMKSSVTSLSVVILLTIQGVCGEEWSVTYKSESTCAFVGSSVEISCFYTSPSVLTFIDVYWAKHNKDPPDLRADPDYRRRFKIVWRYLSTNAGKCTLQIYTLTKLDSGIYYSRITTNYEGQKGIGTPGFNLDVKDAPQTSVSISPPGDIQEGTDVTLTCTTTSDLPVRSYSWTKNVTTHLKKIGTRKTFTIKHFTPGDSGLYLCVSEYECGSRFSSTVHLQVSYPPKNTRIESDPSGEMIEGSTVTLTCMSEADPPVHTYTWIKKSGAVELKSGKEKTLIFSKIRSEDRGEYLCQAANRVGQQNSLVVSVQVLYRPKKTAVSFSDDSVMAMGNTVTLTCSSDANPPVEIYTWFKEGESTPVGSGQQYSITNISSEDGGQYYCEARNKYGDEDSNAVSIMEDESVPGAQIPVLTVLTVLTVSVCGLLGLFCGVFWLSKKCKKEMLARGRNDQDAGDSVGNTQRENPNIVQMSLAGQILNPNTIQPDAVYQNLNPNTTQPDAVYQSLDPNSIQPDAVYQSLDPNTIQPDAVYQSLDPNTTQPDAVYQSLDPNTIQSDAVYQRLNPNTTQPDAVYQSLDPNTTQPDAVYQTLNPNIIQPDAVYQSLDPNTIQPDAVYQSLNPNTT